MKCRFNFAIPLSYDRVFSAALESVSSSVVVDRRVDEETFLSFYVVDSDSTKVMDFLDELETAIWKKHKSDLRS